MSSPIRSASASGPIGCAQPLIIPSSMSSLDAKPDSYIRIAESRYGMSSALTTKPARSCESMQTLPSVSSAKLRARSSASSPVMIERTTSTSGSTGHRVEEVQAEHALGLRGPGAELHDRHRRRVGGEELGVGQHRVQALEELALGRLVLDDRLDRGVGALEVVDRGGVGEALVGGRRGRPRRACRTARRGPATWRSAPARARPRRRPPRPPSRRRPRGRTPPRCPSPSVRRRPRRSAWRGTVAGRAALGGFGQRHGDRRRRSSAAWPSREASSGPRRARPRPAWRPRPLPCGRCSVVRDGASRPRAQSM